MSNDDRDDEYEVGYKKPPKKNQFQPGRSGNLSGRPKGSKNFKTELQEELSETVSVKEGAKVRRVSKRRAILKRAVEKALKGDTRSIDLVVRWTANYLGVEDDSGGRKTLSPDDQAILDRFIAQRSEGETANRNEDRQTEDDLST